MPFFDVLDELAPHGDGFRVTLPDAWLQGRSVFGGLQAALALRAMRSLVGDQLPLRSLSTTFVAPVPSGSIDLSASVLRQGSSATQAECRLVRGPDTLCVLVAVFGSARPSAVDIQPTAPVEPCVVDSLDDVPYLPDLMPRCTQFFQLRWCEGPPPFTGAKDPRTKIYARLREPARDPDANLLAVADSIPSPGISLLERPASASSLSWMLELVAPAPSEPDAWFRLDSEVTSARDGYLNQSSLVWSPAGELVALSRQTVALFG